MPPVNAWIAKAIVLLASVAMVVIPHSLHGKRSQNDNVKKSRRGALESLLLALTAIGFTLPLIWVATPVLAFADYPLKRFPLIAGSLCIAAGLWLHYRSHAELGESWSITLEVRERHRLVTGGIYRLVRHPMYLALLVYSTGQALILPNWVAGPSYLVATAILFVFRVGPEERMMIKEFGKEYEDYMTRTKRVVPGVW